MAKERPENKEGLASEIREYTDVRLDEFKLKATRSLSSILSQVLSLLLVIALLVTLLGLLSVALLQWLNNIFGDPIGTLIVAGFIVLLLVITLIFRKKMFHNRFVKMFIDAFYNDDEDE